VRNLDQNKIIDMNGAVELLGGMKELFYRMLIKYEAASKLDDNMAELGKGLEEVNTDRMKGAAHKIKGSSGYVGASRLHYATFCIHECSELNSDDYEGMIHYYQSVVEAVIEFKIYSRYFLS
jgi:HPt (histidine-containing phosphotransfer) domain-containing protein